MEPPRPTETLTIKGMSCTHCVSAVREALERVPGASVVSVEIGRAEADMDPTRAARADLIAAIEDAGFDVTGG
ncbi:MAG: cation transporter [Bacteroidota bacterium]